MVSSPNSNNTFFIHPFQTLTKEQKNNHFIFQWILSEVRHDELKMWITFENNM